MAGFGLILFLRSCLTSPPGPTALWRKTLGKICVESGQLFLGASTMWSLRTCLVPACLEVKGRYWLLDLSGTRWNRGHSRLGLHPVKSGVSLRALQAFSPAAQLPCCTSSAASSYVSEGSSSPFLSG